MSTQEQITHFRTIFSALRDEVGKIIVGHESIVDNTLVAILAGGHVLLEGVPGLGKTLLVRTLGEVLDLSFSRIQFTPDLMPADILGTNLVMETPDGRRLFEFQKGPIFAHLILADEINRATPKTQSAMLEAMQEHSVTAGGALRRLTEPFFVLATQNPIELEGTYPLPEAQLDRFLFKVEVPGVSADVMTQILTSRRRGQAPALEVALTAKEIDELFAFVDGIFLPQAVANYIARLVAATHPQRSDSLAAVQKNVRFGASPRAAIAIGEAARAAALLAGRPNVDFADVQRVALPALAHRVVLQHAAVVNGITSAKLVQDLLETVPAVAKALPGAVQ